MRLILKRPKETVDLPFSQCKLTVRDDSLLIEDIPGIWSVKLTAKNMKKSPKTVYDEISEAYACRKKSYVVEATK